MRSDVLGRVARHSPAEAAPAVGELPTLLALLIMAAGAPVLIPALGVPAPQVVVGILVNLALLLAAFHLPAWHHRLPICLAPPAMAVLAGGVFGPEITAGLLLFAMVAMVGNAVLVATARAAATRWPIEAALTAAAALKATTMLVLVSLLLGANLLPATFGLVVAPLQLVTALVASWLTLPALRRAPYRP